MQRLSRNEKREQTRLRLRESAVQAFASQGVGAASVDRISESAGLSRGAFYANYDTKEDLLLELMSEQLEREAVAWRKVVDEADGAEAILRGFIARFEASNRSADWSLLMMELTLHAERNPAFGDHYHAFLGAHHEHVAVMFVALFAKLGLRPPAEPAALAAAAMSFGNAVALQSSHGVRRGDPTYASEMFALYLRGLIAVAEPLPATPVAALRAGRAGRKFA